MMIAMPLDRDALRREALTSKRISFCAKVLFCIMLDTADEAGVIVNVSKLSSHSRIGRRSTQRALVRLVDAGLIHREGCQDGQARFRITD